MYQENKPFGYIVGHLLDQTVWRLVKPPFESQSDVITVFTKQGRIPTGAYVFTSEEAVRRSVKILCKKEISKDIIL